MDIQFFKDMYERDHFFRNMLRNFESLYAHTREHIQDKNHNDKRHVHKQEQYHHNVKLAFHVQ